MFCPKCGAPNDTSARFCSTCGAAMPAQQPMQSTQPVPVIVQQVRPAPVQLVPAHPTAYTHALTGCGRSLSYLFAAIALTAVAVLHLLDLEDAVKFIFANKEKRIKVEYTGGKHYILYIADADKKAIASTYELAVVLSDIEKLTKEKEKATKKLAYLEKKLSGKK